MSEEMTMLPGRGMRVGSSQPQQREITVDNNRQHIDELLEVIKGANGMPVLLLTSSDGRLSAIAMDDLQNMVPTNREVNDSTEKKFQDLRAWMLLIMSLAATVTFTAGLTPPGGFWADDKEKQAGQPARVAGTPVMRYKFPTRYQYYMYSNSLAFFFSLMTIAMLAINKRPTALIRDTFFPCFVFFSFASLMASYISGTWDSKHTGNVNISIFNIYVLANVPIYVGIHWFLLWRQGEQPQKDMNNS